MVKPDDSSGMATGRYAFVVPESVFGRLIEKRACEDLDASVLLFVVFQELLRRYNREECVAASYAAGTAAPAVLTLSGTLSLRETVAAFQSELAAGRRTGDASARFAFSDQDSPLPDSRATTCDISLAMALGAQQLQGCLQYNLKAYPWYVAQSLGDRFAQMLDSALNQPDIPLHDLAALSSADLTQFASWNETSRTYPSGRADQLFDLSAETRPDAVAAVFQGRSYTYRELAARATRLAAKLHSLGVAPGELVAVYIERCLDVPTAMLGVLKAGGAFLALDPSLPADRVRFMLEDGQAKVILTHSHLLGQLPPANAETLCLDLLDYEEPIVPLLAASIGAGPDDLAYILYTSGSTGKPKGVEITHRGLTNLLLDMVRQLALGESDVVLATAALSFDISSFEVLAPLIAGARVVVVPRGDTTNGEALSRVIAAEGATLVQATPSGWRILLETGWTGHPGLKLMTCAEPLDRRLAQQLLARGQAVWNLYGPTETTVYSTLRKIRSDDEALSVGHALSNCTTYILDRNGKQAPPGATGELFIGGTGLARGYRNRADLTAERFVPDPFSQLAQAKMYGSGDLARYWPDGQIEILGRIDNQVKIRGYRIELEEIERVLAECEMVSGAVVKVIDYGNSDLRLVAFVVPAQAGSPIKDELLRNKLLAALPVYMVPTVFCSIEKVPLTPSGKVDRQSLALPRRLDELTPPTGSGKEAPQTELERLVLTIWRSVLKVTDLRMDDDFFDCGGHSLLAARMFAQLSVKLGQKLSVTLLLEARTARQLAQRIASGNEKPQILVSLREGGSLPPLYLVHHLLGDAMLYRHIADCFADDQRPVFGIQACLEILSKPDYRSVEKLAAVYLDEILARQPDGPFHIAGYSSGGPIAYEMARQLREQGYQVGLVGLIDASLDHRPAPMERWDRYRKLAVQKACRIAFKLRYELSVGPVETVNKRVKSLLLSSKVKRLARSSAQAGTLLLEEALLLAERGYQPRSYEGTALLVRYADEAKRFGPDPLMGWSGMFRDGKLQIVDLPGNHVSGLFPPRVATLAALLQDHMERIENLPIFQHLPASRTA